MSIGPGHLRMLALIFAALAGLSIAINYAAFLSPPGYLALIGIAALMIPSVFAFRATQRVFSEEETPTETLEASPVMGPVQTTDPSIVQQIEDLRAAISELQNKSAENTAAVDALGANNQQLETVVKGLEESFDEQLARQRKRSRDGVTILETIKDAINEGRVEFHLQPIVSLPQRRVAFYEGFTRLRRVDGSLIFPPEFLRIAEAAKLSGVIDNMLVYRAVQVIERLTEGRRRVGVFCNISLETVRDDKFFPAFVEYLRTKTDLAGSLIFEFRANALSDPIFKDRIATLTSMGYRLSIDDAENISTDLSQLRAMGVRYLKVECHKAREFIARLNEQATDDSGAEASEAIESRFGLTIIAQKVEEEREVGDILEQSIPFGQGSIFGGPRPVKKSLMAESLPASPAAELDELKQKKAG